MRSKRWWVFKCANRISTFLRSSRVTPDSTGSAFIKKTIGMFWVVALATCAAPGGSLVPGGRQNAPSCLDTAAFQFVPRLPQPAICAVTTGNITIFTIAKHPDQRRSQTTTKSLGSGQGPCVIPLTVATVVGGVEEIIHKRGETKLADGKRATPGNPQRGPTRRKPHARHKDVRIVRCFAGYDGCRDTGCCLSGGLCGMRPRLLSPSMRSRPEG
jgi:hypothetical protein